MERMETKRQYSPIAREITERFSSPAKRDEFFARGLIATNNLGLHIKVMDAAPGSPLHDFYFPRLTLRSRQLLETVRTEQPDLWQQTLEADDATGVIMDKYWDTGKAFGWDHPQAKALATESDVVYWQAAEFKTQVFDAMEQAGMTLDEAVALCI